MDVKARSESRGKWLNRYRYELGELIDIARALTTEREIDKLLGLILEKSRFVTGADAGSLYVVEGDDPRIAHRTLHFKLSQNDSVSFDSREFTMPISARSMAGYVALEQKTLRIDDVYDMPAGAPFGFDRSFDEKVGYRTKSMLVTPLTSSKGEVIGVLQLINKKREPKQKLLSPAEVEQSVVPFDERSEELVKTLAAQAGIALENAILYDDIRKIFEGFVQASVDAIEARDPTTSGHSRRVADLTVGLAMAVERADSGPYRAVSWTREDIREIEYASLLHDFGKIGVREHVLVKAKKLYPGDLELIRQRFEFVIRTVEAEIFARKLSLAQRGGREDDLARARPGIVGAQEGARGRLARRRGRERADRARRRRLQAHRRARAAVVHAPRRAGRNAAQRARGAVAQRHARLAHERRVRRDPKPRFAHLPLSLADPLGHDLFARRAHRRRPPRTPERHRLSQAPARRGNPAAIEAHERQRHLRRAHGERSAVQARRPRRKSPPHSLARGEGRPRRRRPRAHLHRSARVGARHGRARTERYPTHQLHWGESRRNEFSSSITSQSPMQRAEPAVPPQ